MKRIKSIVVVFIVVGFLTGCASVFKKEKFINMPLDKTRNIAVEEVFDLEEDYYYVTIKNPHGEFRSYYVNITFVLRWYRNAHLPKAEIFYIELKERRIK